MRFKKWEELPHEMQCDEVKYYYDIIYHHRTSLIIKRVFDFVIAAILLICLLPIFLLVSIAVVADSKGSIFFLQERVTSFGKKFQIIKFRTMVSHADSIDSQLTTEHDSRITKTGSFLRKSRLDEIPQLICILMGSMSFVGTRPEVTKYVERYTNSMLATLLLPAGVTSEASILFKDEYRLLNENEDVEDTYIHKVLPQKMIYNLRSIEHYSLMREVRTIYRTVLAVLGKTYSDNTSFVNTDTFKDKANDY